jgi:hypothetical protein
MLPRPPHFYSILYCRQVWVRQVSRSSGLSPSEFCTCWEIGVLISAAQGLSQSLGCCASVSERNITIYRDSINTFT